MNKLNIQKKILKILEKNKKIKLKTFKEKLNYLYLDNGHIDSLHIMKFILNLENDFKIRFSSIDTHSKKFRSTLGISKIIYNKINVKKK